MANKKFTPRASSNLIEEGVADVNTNVEEEVNSAENTEEVTTSAENTVPETAGVSEDNNTEEVSADESTEETSDEGAKEPEEPKTVTETNNEVTFKAETNKKPIERMVKIRLAKKYDGCIGGVWYHFAKDQVVTVPENVKRILNKAEGMLKPL